MFILADSVVFLLVMGKPEPGVAYRSVNGAICNLENNMSLISNISATITLLSVE